MFATMAPEEALADVTSLVSQAAAILSRFPRKRPFEGFPEAANAGDPHAFFDHSPFAGRANPLAPPIEMEIANDQVIARVNYGAAYEGPPGSVHGGHVAAAFDEVLGMAQSLGGQPGMTGTLTIRYRKPPPLHTDLRIVAWNTGRERRKTFTSGTMYAGDVVTAEAEAIFISVDMARIAEMMAKRSGSAE
jgi:acyl-coenzyme A thioesterase PaaI-like protein